MSKVAIVYWSGTGNTKAMAGYVAEGAESKGCAVDIITADMFSASKMSEYDAVAFGCPSMGSEVLEEDVFQPMFDDVKGSIAGKKIALFGSYDWGSGEWMDEWENECKSLGAVMDHGPVICVLEPDAAAADECRSLGASMA